jgi:4-hydroxy-tetrahydrodipicolinate reductase
VPTRLIVFGAAGRLGRQIIAATAGSSDVTVGAALVRPGSPILGQDAGTLAGVAPLGVPLTSVIPSALARGDVVVDASAPAASVEVCRQAAAAAKPILIATTGLSPTQLAEVRACAAQTAVLVAANLSLGVNLLADILPTIVQALGSDYDVEIVEAHHRHKKDAPSGTAIRLAEAIAEALDRPLAELARYGRSGLAPRQAGEIGFHSLRLGGITGEHHVRFANEGEEIELVHRAFSRETFARGALRAARFLADQPPGWYTMRDVLFSN